MDVTLLSGVVRNRKVSMRVFIAIFFYICMFNCNKSCFVIATRNCAYICLIVVVVIGL